MRQRDSRCAVRRIAAIAFAVFAVVGCSKEPTRQVEKRELSAPVREAVYRIGKLERASVSEHSAKVVDVSGMSAADFRRELEAFAGKDVHVWMPGEKNWLLIGNLSTNPVPLAKAMDAFAADTNCTMSVAEVFASYAGTREDILPAFKRKLKGEVVPEWFVTKDIPEIKWLDTSGVDEDILKTTLSGIRSAQVMRRELLRGNMLAAKATDKKSEEAATEVWAKVAIRSPNDPMLLERIERLNNNAKGFLSVGKVLQAMKCYETVVLIRPNDAAAVHNFGMCLMKIGKRDMAEKVLKRAEKLASRGEGERLR